MNDILKTQQSFARKATARPEHRFEDLYHLICRREWLETALKHVLSNKGARTPGVDGVTKDDLKTLGQQRAFLDELQAELKTNTYQPLPVRREWIDKPGKTEKRPLGIPAIRDRVVQETLRMLMEPIWESDFLDCSSGFRPGRRTMDCVSTFYKRVTTRNKYYWAIEGDIRKCFDRVNHDILLKLVRRRIKDHRIVKLITASLKSGVMDTGLFHETEDGTPQGGILSPLLANIYLHELDLWWWHKFGNLTRYQKSKRRQQMQGNAVLVRYADDFVILWNGTHEDAKALKQELKQFLWDELRLELSEEKTHITHLFDGIDFLGFNLKLILSNTRKPSLRVRPTRRNLQRFRNRIKDLTKRNTTATTQAIRLKSLNRIIRGWGNYYRHVSFKRDASKLDFWMSRRILIWLKHKHIRRGKRWLLKRYLLREVTAKYNRDNFGVMDTNGKIVFLAKLADIPLKPYRYRKQQNPYLNTEEVLQVMPEETPILDPHIVNLPPHALNWEHQRQRALKRDNWCCKECGTTTYLDVHHIKARQHGGTDRLDNLRTLCRDCHARTPSYGSSTLREERT